MESMVEDINNLLNSGEVPNLYTIDEKIELCDKILVIDKQRDKSLQVYVYFIFELKGCYSKNGNNSGDLFTIFPRKLLIIILKYLELTIQISVPKN